MLRPRFLNALALSFLAAACAHDVEDFESSESALLPNGTVFETGHDGATYRLIAESFASRGLDMHVDLSTFAPEWPLADDKTVALNRFGTPILYAQYAYYHTGLAVMRSGSTVDTHVLAPHDGLAMVFDWSGNRISQVTHPYATIVAIYDPVSHVVTQLMHVAPSASLVQSTEPVPVTKGSVIGKLAPAPLSTQADASRLANTQLVFVDGENQKLLNPATLIGGYKDTVAPEAKGLYATDAAGEALAELASGDLDLVVEVADRDDDSNRNFEVSAIEFSVTDQDGNVLASNGRCALDDLYASVAGASQSRARELVDFGSAAGQIAGAWPNSDVDNPWRTFRYALTNLASEGGRCVVRDDASSFLTIGDAVTKLDVSVTLWDAKGNTSTKSFELARPAAPEE
ncbi:MAG: hypothetical protein KF764_04740 [Labilithrix sp.]|nr:hypothetical protein [Labilithrix sp.]